jgi:integral membrane sensor domain MASE1
MGVSRHEEVSSAQGGGSAVSRWSALLRPALVFLVYLAGYVALDFATEGIKGSLDVSLWFPPVGLTFALLLVFGWRYAPAVAVVFLLHLLLFRGGLDYPVVVLVTIPVVYAVLYTGAAVLLERGLKIDPRLTGMRDVVWFVVVACVSAPLLIAAVTVWGFVMGGYAPAGAFWDDLFGSWAGDATGIAVLTSFLLVASRPFGSLWARRSPGPTREATASFQWPTRRELPEVIL